MQYVLRRSGLRVPGGYQAGFNPNHIAAGGMASGYGLSAVPINGTFTNLLNGATATVSSGATAAPRAFAATIGEAAYCQTSVVGLYQFSGQRVVNNPSATLAAFCVFKFAASFSCLLNTDTQGPGGGGSYGFSLFSDASNNLMLRVAGTNVPSGLVLTSSVPYFVAASFNANVTNFVALRLDTGQLFTASVSSSVSITANNGIYSMGNWYDTGGGDFPAGYLGPVMWSPSFMSLRAMRQWAADPWSFWYPTPLSDKLAFTRSVPVLATTQSGSLIVFP